MKGTTHDDESDISLPFLDDFKQTSFDFLDLPRAHMHVTLAGTRSRFIARIEVPGKPTALHAGVSRAPSNLLPDVEGGVSMAFAYP